MKSFLPILLNLSSIYELKATTIISTFISNQLHHNRHNWHTSNPNQPSSLYSKKSKMKNNRPKKDANLPMNNDVEEVDSDKIKVAVIGGGIAGLSCAAHLTKLSSKVVPTVFDTGRLRAGGRCSTRMPGDPPPKNRDSKSKLLSDFVIDHAAQILTVPLVADRNGGEHANGDFDAFRDQVEEWEREGVLRKFPPKSVVDILSNPEQQSNTLGSPRVKVLNDANTSSSRNELKPASFMYYGMCPLQLCRIQYNIDVTMMK